MKNRNDPWVWYEIRSALLALNNIQFLIVYTYNCTHTHVFSFWQQVHDGQNPEWHSPRGCRTTRDVTTYVFAWKGPSHGASAALFSAEHASAYGSAEVLFPTLGTPSYSLFAVWPPDPRNCAGLHCSYSFSGSRDGGHTLNKWIASGEVIWRCESTGASSEAHYC